MLGLRLGWVGGGWGVSFWKRKQDRGREPWMARWQAAAVTPPLRKASHHFVKPYRSQAESGKDRDGKIQEGIMFLCKSGCLEFDHARCKGWHFTNTLFLALAFQINKKPLITMQIKKKKKGGGWVDTQRADTLNNAAISLPLPWRSLPMPC